MLKVSRTAIIEFNALILCIALSLCLFVLERQNVIHLTSDDSVGYYLNAKEFCKTPLSPFVSALSSGNPTSLNWSTIVTIGALACYVNEEYLGAIIFGINLLVLSLTFLVYGKVTNHCVSPANGKLFFLLFIFQTWLFTSLISLNKEVISYLVVALLFLLFLRGAALLLILAGIIGGLIKIQFLVFSLMLVAVLKGVSAKKQLLAVAALLTVIYNLYDFNMFNADYYYGRFGYPIRTAEIAANLNKIVALPFGFIVVFPVRFLINIFSSFSPFRILSISSWQELFYQFNALIFSISIVVWLVRIFLRKNSANNSVSQFIFLYSMLVCLLPFFQLRYFFPILPIVLLALMTPKGRLRHSYRNSTFQTMANRED